MTTSELADPRRRALLFAGAAGAGIAALSGCEPAAAPAVADALAPDPRVAPATRPKLTAQATEGPYYFDAGKVRADITEGLPGIALELTFRIVDERGLPLAGARVDVWHCNAAGVYSGYANQAEGPAGDTTGRTFLRGTQDTGGDGIVTFRTVYPGWYRGRTTHIHFKVFQGERAVLTSQFFLPDALSEFLYTEVPAYVRDAPRDTFNRTDGIALQAGDGLQGCVREQSGRYAVHLDVAVDRTASPVADAGRGPSPAERPPGPPSMRAAPTGSGRIESLVPSAQAGTTGG